MRGLERLNHQRNQVRMREHEWEDSKVALQDIEKVLVKQMLEDGWDQLEINEILGAEDPWVSNETQIKRRRKISDLPDPMPDQLIPME